MTDTESIILLGCVILILFGLWVLRTIDRQLKRDQFFRVYDKSPEQWLEEDLIPKLNQIVEESKLSREEAQKQKVCRICKKDLSTTPDNPFVINDNEYAHKECVDRERVVSGVLGRK